MQNVIGVNYLTGWSIRYEDIIKKGDPLFRDCKNKNLLDGRIAHGKRKLMKGKTGLLYDAIRYCNYQVDFFFCDTGEYCGIVFRLLKS